MLAPMTTIQHPTVDTSEKESSFLHRGENGAYVRMSPTAHFLIQEKASGKSFEDISKHIKERFGQSVSTEEVERHYDKIAAQLNEINSRETDKLPFGFWLTLTLIPDKLVQAIAPRLTFLYHPITAAILLLLVGYSGWIASLQSHTFTHDASTFWIGFSLFFISMLVHEFGHSSACARFSVMPRSIGFGLYMIYPVFYSDVSAAWELKRWQRVVVDLGGVYFQSIVFAAYVFLYAITDWQPLLVAQAWIVGSIIFSLNPILRLDGYWVIADALGVTTLKGHLLKIARTAYCHLRRIPAPPLPWHWHTAALIALFSIFSVAVWGWFMWKMIPWLIAQVIAYPSVCSALISNLQHDQIGFSDVNEFLRATYFVVIVGLMLYQFSKPVMGYVQRYRLVKKHDKEQLTKAA
jgi:putative peptide zinc metalloprotease protein